MSHSVWNKQKRWAWVLNFRPKPPMLSVLSVKTNQNSKLKMQRNLLNQEGKFWSGRMDLNHRPPGPEPGALARLRYAPTGPLRAKDSFRVELSEYHSSPADGSGAASHQCLWSIIARANKLKVGLSRDS